MLDVGIEATWSVACANHVSHCVGSKKPTAAVVGGDGGDGGDGGGILIFPHRMEPVGIFWDIENCPVPVGKAAFSLATKMRRVFFEGKREAEFMCVCDVTKEKEEVTDALHNAQVYLHVHNVHGVQCRHIHHIGHVLYTILAGSEKRSMHNFKAIVTIVFKPGMMILQSLLYILPIAHALRVNGLLL